MTKLTLLLLFFSSFSWASETVLERPQPVMFPNGNPMLQLADGKYVPIQACYTSDGAGHLAPIASTEATIGTVQQGGQSLAAAPWQQDIEQVLGASVSASNPLPVQISDGTNLLGTGVHPFPITAPSAIPISPNGFSFSHITGNATTQVKSGSGLLHSICINDNTQGGTVSVYNATSGTSNPVTLLAEGTAGNTDGPFCTGSLDINFSTGLRVITAGSTSNDITVIYQ